jgi:putative oxidoreductase
MIDNRTAPYAVFALRVALGMIFLIHGGIKLFVFTPAGTVRYFNSLELPPIVAYVTMGWELIGGLALVLGIWPRIVALAFIPELIGTIVVAHAANGFLFSNPKGGWEFSAFLIVSLLVLAALGDGAFALKPDTLERAFGRSRDVRRA